MNKTIIVVLIVLVIGVFGFVMMRHNSKVAMNPSDYQPVTSTTYQNSGTTATTPSTGTSTGTGTTTSAPTDISKTNLDSSLKGLDSQAAGLDANSDDLNF